MERAFLKRRSVFLPILLISFENKARHKDPLIVFGTGIAFHAAGHKSQFPSVGGQCIQFVGDNGVVRGNILEIDTTEAKEVEQFGLFEFIRFQVFAFHIALAARFTVGAGRGETTGIGVAPFFDDPGTTQTGGNDGFDYRDDLVLGLGGQLEGNQRSDTD